MGFSASDLAFSLALQKNERPSFSSVEARQTANAEKGRLPQQHLSDKPGVRARLQWMENIIPK